MPEMWAHCQPCSRWFFIPFSTGETMARSTCPVCASQPVRFEVRTDSSSFPLELSEDAAIH